MDRKTLLRGAVVTFFMSLSCLFSFSQTTRTISGVVKDNAGEVMIGVNVLIKGTTNGTITDIDGNYKLTGVSERSVLVVSYIGYLTQEEVESIIEKRFPTKRLEQVRDIFVFSCFCGLAYIDVKKLRKENIRTSFDGNLWIIGKREKTDVTFSIPLLDIPKRILEKYEGTLPDNRILPVPSNQKMNAYLKETAVI